MKADRRRLRFGLWYAFRNPAQWQTSDRDLYAEVLDQIAWAETIGYDDVWLTASEDHSFTIGMSGHEAGTFELLHDVAADAGRYAINGFAAPLSPTP
jgi:hypothetical protein